MTEFFGEIAQFFSIDFVKRAVVVGGMVSLCAALLGVSLVLKRYSMIGDGLSHIGFASLALASALGLNDVQLWLSIPVVVLAAFLLLRLSESSKIKGDAAIAILSTVSLAAGYIAMYRAGTNVDVSNYMFGNLFTVRTEDAFWSVFIALAVVLLFLLFYQRIFAVTFDEVFAKGVGIRVSLYNMVIAILTAVTIVLGMRMMGTLLISALVIFPALTAMRVCKSFCSVVWCSVGISFCCFFVGIVSAHLLVLPAGSTIVLVNGLAFLLFSIIGFFRGKGNFSE